MTERSSEEIAALAESLGPAEKLLDLIINFPDHLWHNRPGILDNGKWRAATRKELVTVNSGGHLGRGLVYQAPGPNVGAIERVYTTLGDIWNANSELAARLASYIMKETDWRDMKVVCAAFMLVQKHSGEPITEEIDGRKQVLFYDDDYRAIGEAMVKFYARGSDKMMNPKLIRRIGDVLNLPGVVDVNKLLGFGNMNKRKPFTGRYYKSVTDWLSFREANSSMLDGLKRSGYASTVKGLSRMVGYKPESQRFFEVLGWKQKQAADGHREIGLDGLNIVKLSFEGLSEAEICEMIQRERLGWKPVMGMIPASVGLTPAIFVSMMEQFSDKDLVILTPTLESFNLLAHAPIKARWQEALANQQDQRARNVAKNLKNRETAQALEDAADGAVTKAVTEATEDADVHILFLIDISASMQGAIELSKEALSMIVQGFPEEKLHIACFNTIGYRMQPKHYSAAGIRHMLSSVNAGGGTIYSSALAVLFHNRVRIPEGAELIIFAVGDEAGEVGKEFGNNCTNFRFKPAAFAHIVNVARGWQRGRTVRDAASHLGVPYTEVGVEQFTDVYQVQRTLKAVLEAQSIGKRGNLVEKILRTPLLEKPY